MNRYYDITGGIWQATAYRNSILQHLYPGNIKMAFESWPIFEIFNNFVVVFSLASPSWTTFCNQGKNSQTKNTFSQNRSFSSYFLR